MTSQQKRVALAIAGTITGIAAVAFPPLWLAWLAIVIAFFVTWTSDDKK